mgnify:CR=1 FL=1
MEGRLLNKKHFLPNCCRLFGVLALGLSMSNTAGAADAKGNFAIDGGGSQPCESFTTAKTKKTTDYQIYAGWVDGYVTAANQYSKDTYDLTPWQTTELLLSALVKHCTANPTQPFIIAVNNMLAALKPARLQNKSELVMVQTTGGGSLVYKAVLESVQRKLAEKKLYSGKIDGAYSPAVRDALRAYQGSERISASGLPDQATLLKLLK